MKVGIKYIEMGYRYRQYERNSNEMIGVVGIVVRDRIKWGQTSLGVSIIMSNSNIDGRKQSKTSGVIKSGPKHFPLSNWLVYIPPCWKGSGNPSGFSASIISDRKSSVPLIYGRNQCTALPIPPYQPQLII